MISYEKALVKNIVSQDLDTTWIEVECENRVKKAVNYNKLSGDIKVGDQVIINTTAVDLSLGTGGQHFVIFNYSQDRAKLDGKGHIMKLRYSPYQIRVLAAEEEQSIHHEKVKNFKSLDKHIVVVGTLHSMLGPISAMLKYLKKDLKVNYIMTDAGALPIGFSNTVKKLKGENLIDHTITVGHAFGGDYESVNIYTGLIVSKEVLGADITIITMGPGIVGTGTKYGFSGIEQGINIDAVNNLGGYPIAVPRIGFKDERDRHKGLSHQSITVFNNICNTRANIIFPKMKSEKETLVKAQIRENSIDKNHNIFFESGEEIRNALEKYNLNTTTMGRGIDEDPEFFYTLGAIGKYAINQLSEEC